MLFRSGVRCSECGAILVEPTDTPKLQYVITIDANGGTVKMNDTVVTQMPVDKGTPATALSTLTVTPPEHYIFSKWQMKTGEDTYADIPENATVQSDMIIKAVYDLQVFTVTWMNGEEELKKEELAYGSTPVAPDINEPTMIVTWTPSIAEVVDNVTYNLSLKKINYAGSLWDFTDPTIVKNDKKQADNGSYYVEYLDSFDGENNVVKVTNLREGDWNWDIWFLSGYTAFRESISDDADTLFIKLKSTVATRTTMYGGGADVGASLILYEYVLPTEWTTIEITGDKFAAFKQYLAYYRGAFQAWMESPGSIYISDIYVGKKEALTNNNQIAFGEVTLDDNSATAFNGYSNLALEVRDSSNNIVPLTDNKFTANESGIYKVTYMALMSDNNLKVGSYSILSLKKNDLGTFKPLASDWHSIGWEGKEYSNEVLDEYADHVINVNDACWTQFDALRAYMANNSITTVKLRFDFITNTKISMGQTIGDNTTFPLNDNGGAGILFNAGTYFEFTVNMLEFDRMYVQVVWDPCEFILTYEFVN